MNDFQALDLLYKKLIIATIILFIIFTVVVFANGWQNL